MSKTEMYLGLYAIVISMELKHKVGLPRKNLRDHYATETSQGQLSFTPVLSVTGHELVCQ